VVENVQRKAIKIESFDVILVRAEKDGHWSGFVILQQLGSLLTANAYPRVRCEFSYGERRG